MATFMKFRLVPAREEVSLFRQSYRAPQELIRGPCRRLMRMTTGTGWGMLRRGGKGKIGSIKEQLVWIPYRPFLILFILAPGRLTQHPNQDGGRESISPGSSNQQLLQQYRHLQMQMFLHASIEDPIFLLPKFISRWPRTTNFFTSSFSTSLGQSSPTISSCPQLHQ